MRKKCIIEPQNHKIIPKAGEKLSLNNLQTKNKKHQAGQNEHTFFPFPHIHCCHGHRVLDELICHLHIHLHKNVFNGGRRFFPPLCTPNPLDLGAKWWRLWHIWCAYKTPEIDSLNQQRQSKQGIQMQHVSSKNILPKNSQLCSAKSNGTVTFSTTSDNRNLACAVDSRMMFSSDRGVIRIVWSRSPKVIETSYQFCFSFVCSSSAHTERSLLQIHAIQQFKTQAIHFRSPSSVCACLRVC